MPVHRRDRAVEHVRPLQHLLPQYGHLAVVAGQVIRPPLPDGFPVKPADEVGDVPDVGFHSRRHVLLVPHGQQQVVPDPRQPLPLRPVRQGVQDGDGLRDLSVAQADVPRVEELGDFLRRLTFLLVHLGPTIHRDPPFNLPFWSVRWVLFSAHKDKQPPCQV